MIFSLHFIKWYRPAFCFSNPTTTRGDYRKRAILRCLSKWASQTNVMLVFYYPVYPISFLQQELSIIRAVWRKAIWTYQSFWHTCFICDTQENECQWSRQCFSLLTLYNINCTKVLLWKRYIIVEWYICFSCIKDCKKFVCHTQSYFDTVWIITLCKLLYLYKNFC